MSTRSRSSTKMTVGTLLLTMAPFWGISQATNGENNVCGLWLAPSTIPGAGLGMFAGKDYAIGELVSTDLVVAITDLAMHNQEVEYGSFLWDEYTWSASSLKLHGEGVAEVNVASPGFGAAANCILALFNVEEYAPIPDDAALHSRQYPSTGAITAHHQRRSTAKREIVAGSELLVSYGSDWFTSRTQLGPIPLYDEMEQGSVLLRRFKALMSVESNDTVLRDIWDTFIQKTAFKASRTLVGTLGNVPWETYQEVHREKYQNNVTAVHAAAAQRNLTWLQDHGTCGDVLVPAVSTAISRMGYGAFVQRPVTAGSVVAPMPLIHLRNRTQLNMYALNRTSWDSVLPDSKVVGQQLLLNYCYGHGDSTLLLCPYGPLVNFVNHNQTLANVKLQWADPQKSNHHPELLNRPVSELPASSAQLAMELVALRDLEVGEEVFLDYGDAWEAAWQKHVLEWAPDMNYQSAAEIQQRTKVFPTVFEELRERTIPNNVEFQCDSAFRHYPKDCAEHFAKGTLNDYLQETEADWWTCEILRRSADDVFYAVYMYDADKTQFIVENVTGAALHLVDRPYTSNTFLPQAFRHDIRIPDEIFPKAWKNNARAVKKAAGATPPGVVPQPSSERNQCDMLRGVLNRFQSYTGTALYPVIQSGLSMFCAS